jgi:hypothetical protein
MKMFDITNISNIDQLIEKVNLNLCLMQNYISMRRLILLMEIGVIIYTSIIDKYYDYLSKIIVTVD